MIYTITYYRKDKNSTETKPVKADTMALAVRRLLDTAKHHGTEISSLTIKIDGTGTNIAVCDKCQAIKGIKNYMCRECRNA